VINACHSQNLGLRLAEAGAEHVVCIDQKEELNDEAAIVFTRTFY
jgi:hypothetical protein